MQTMMENVTALLKGRCMVKFKVLFLMKKREHISAICGLCNLTHASHLSSSVLVWGKAKGFCFILQNSYFDFRDRSCCVTESDLVFTILYLSSPMLGFQMCT
jgi:hypothetical protein